MPTRPSRVIPRVIIDDAPGSIRRADTARSSPDRTWRAAPCRKARTRSEGAIHASGSRSRWPSHRRHGDRKRPHLVSVPPGQRASSGGHVGDGTPCHEMPSGPSPRFVERQTPSAPARGAPPRPPFPHALLLTVFPPAGLASPTSAGGDGSGRGTRSVFHPFSRGQACQDTSSPTCVAVRSFHC